MKTSFHEMFGSILLPRGISIAAFICTAVHTLLSIFLSSSCLTLASPYKKQLTLDLVLKF